MKKFFVKGLIILMTISTLVCAGCNPQRPVDPDPTDPPVIDPPEDVTEDFMCFTRKGKYETPLYITKYSDYKAMDEWLSENIGDKAVPPVSFIIDGKSSSELKWEREDGEVVTVFDFEEEAPFERRYCEVTYTAAEEGITVEMTITGYPGYPVVEYSAVLKNVSGVNSGRISDVVCIDTEVECAEGDRLIHANRGSTCSTVDFQALSFRTNRDISFEVTSGKPTSNYMPCFNVENKSNNTGTIAVIDWQGNWKATFSETGSGLNLKAGQYQTDLVLQKDEELRIPGTVLLFYKGDYANGQNIYRRWLYNQMFREQGKHMKSTNVLVCPSGFTEASDLAYIEFYKETGLIDYIDKFNEDGGWAENNGYGWYFTGNWFVNDKAYPDGMKAVADAAHEAGLEFAVWFEPERVAAGTQTAKDLTGDGQIICYNAGSSLAIPVTKMPVGTSCLLNYGDPEVVDYVVKVISDFIKENGVDQYRQDFNIAPAPFWAVYDNTESKALGIPRTGMTENKYTTGYLKVFEGLLENNPGMFIDACASGGMRYDLSTIRYSFMHTRSDNWMDDLSAQIQTYGSSMWTLYWGTGFYDLSEYNIRSHIGNSIGVGVNYNDKKAAATLEEALKEWKELAGYMFYDYYPLTKCSLSAPVAIQYDSPEEGRGMAVAYFRSEGSLDMMLRGLDPKAKYKVTNIDDRDNSVIMTGEELMAGIPLTSDKKYAFVYEYELLEGEDTTAFQKEEVLTGIGSNDYVPDDEELKDMVAPVTDKKYHNRFTEEEFQEMYTITEDDKIEFVAYDYRNSGSLYAISKNVYDEVIKEKTDPIYGVWYTVDRNRMSFGISGTRYNLHTWDGTAFNIMPYVGKFGDSYYLWLSNFTPFSDGDGGWTDRTLTIYWARSTKGTGSCKTKVYMDYHKCQIVNFKETDSDETGRIFSISEEMFNSFIYTGKGLSRDGVDWYQIDRESIGVCSSDVSKMPYEGTDIVSITEFVSTLGEGCNMFAAKDGDNYYLWMKEYDSFHFRATYMAGFRRAVLVWYDSETGELCQQMFFSDMISG